MSLDILTIRWVAIRLTAFRLLTFSVGEYLESLRKKDSKWFEIFKGKVAFEEQ